MEGRAASLPRLWDTGTIAMVAAMCLASILFSYFLLPQSLRLDESQSLWETSRSPSAILATVAQDVHVPVYHELLHGWRNAIGDSVESARMLSLVFFLLSIPALYLVGTLIYGRAVGLFAAFLFALSPFMNWYANEIRMYTLFVFVAIVHQYFFVRLFRRPADDAWIGFGITAVVGIYVHYFFFLILLTEGLFYLLHRKLFGPEAFVRFFTVTAITALSFVPWALYVFHEGQAQNQQPILPVPTTINLFSVFSQFLLGFQSDPVNAFFLSLWPLVIIFAFLALRKRRVPRPETDYLILMVVVPITVAFLISFFVPLFVSRYLIFVVPAFYLLIAQVCARYPGTGKWVAGVSLACLMVVMFGVEAVSAATPVKEEYKGVVAYLSANARPQDVIIVSAPFTIYPIEYYYRGAAPLVTLPEWNRYAHGAIPAFNPDTLPKEVADETGDAHYAWLVLSYDQGYEKQIKSYFDQHFANVYSHTFSNDLSVYEYKIRYDTPLSRLPATTTPATTSPSVSAPRTPSVVPASSPPAASSTPGSSTTASTSAPAHNATTTP